VHCGIKGVPEGGAGPREVKIHQPHGLPVPDNHVLRGHIQVAAQETGRAFETGVLQPVKVVRHGEALRLVWATDRSAHPHHAFGHVARSTSDGSPEAAR